MIGRQAKTGIPACLAVVVLLCLLFPVRAAAEARIGEVVVANSQRELLLYFELQDAITPEMEEGLRSGLPLALTFLVELNRQGVQGPERNLLRLEFEHRLRYDNLKDEYRVTRESQQETQRGTSSLAEARSWLKRVDGLALLPLAQLSPDESYQVRIKAQLAETDLPPALHRLLPFRELWGFETAWQIVDFSY